MRRVIFFHNNISRIATNPEDFLSRFHSYLQVAKNSLGDAPLDLNLLLGRIHTDTRFDEIKVVRLSNSLLSQYLTLRSLLKGRGDEVTAISDILNFKRDVIAKKLGVVSHKIPTLVFLNWAAPCVIPAVVQENQLNVLSWALADNMQSCAFTIYPTFSYMKGKLHLEETKVTAALTRGNHNIDLQVSILFKDQTDVRDHRPMVYPARLVFPSPLGDPCKSLWCASDLRKNRRTPEIKQISGKSMKEIEDLSVDALPPTTYARDQRSFGGAKYSQLGAPAWDSILSSFFEGPSFTDVPAVLILDLYPRVGEMLEAFCKKRMLFTCSSLFY